MIRLALQEILKEVHEAKGNKQTVTQVQTHKKSTLKNKYICKYKNTNIFSSLNCFKRHTPIKAIKLYCCLLIHTNLTYMTILTTDRRGEE